MILSSVTIIGSHHRMEADLRVSGEKITAISPCNTPHSSDTQKDPPQLTLSGCMAFPGLINSHDHLDFNNFPLLGNRLYSNYEEWGGDIHRNNKDTIDAVLKIPRDLRIKWGIYKNLLGGVTTVINHGKTLPVTDKLIDVYQNAQSLHSLEGEKHWRYKLNFGRPGRPVVIHIGEGTDKMAAAEINTLIKWNLFRRKITGIHGVAMNEQQASAFQSLIWCPDSNYFLLGKTAPVQKFRNKTHLLFGTDSTLTAHWNIWEQLRLAREQEKVTDPELFDMLTRTPAHIWGLKDRGSLEKGFQADIVIAKPSPGSTGWDAFYTLDPRNIQLILYKGNIQLFDGSLLDQLTNASFSLDDFYKIHLNGVDKYIRGDLPALISKIRSYYPLADFPIALS